MKGAPKAPQAAPAVDPRVQKHFAAGVKLQQAGKLDQALAEYKEVLKINPNLMPPLLNMALIYVQKKQLAEAERVLLRVTALDPKNPFALDQLARIQLGRGKGKQAMAYARRLVSVKPKEPSAQFLLGVAAINSKDYATAATAFKVVTKALPDEKGALFNLGYCYVNLKKYKEGLDVLNRLLQKDPGNKRHG